VKDLIDNTEVEKVLAKLEVLEDEAMAVQLLKEFNDATREHGSLLLNKDQNLDHEQWKSDCDKAGARVQEIINKINEL
jgi:hypothetical protein